MDTRFTLLQLKHHCVKATGERPRETNQSQEWKQNGGRAGQDKSEEEGERRRCSHTEKRRSRIRWGSSVGATSPLMMSRGVKGHGSSMGSQESHPCHLFSPRDHELVGWGHCSRSRETEKSSHTTLQPLQNRLLPAREGKKGTKLLKQSVDLGKFLTSKLNRALHLNMFERGEDQEVVVEYLKRNQMVQGFWPFIFFSFELESFLHEVCCHRGSEIRSLWISLASRLGLSQGGLLRKSGGMALGNY